MHKYLIGICICFSHVCHIPIQLNGFHNGGRFPPPVAEAAEGRFHHVGWECGKRKKNICKYLSNISAFASRGFYDIFLSLSLELFI